MKSITEKQKGYVLFVMLIVAGLVGYIRFVRSPGVNEPPAPPNETRLTKTQLPVVQQRSNRTTHFGLETVRPTRRQITRNIFQPTGRLPAMAQTEQATGVHTGNMEMTLNGTLIGSDSSMAIINNRFMTLNQTIGKYRITRITPDRVYLACGKEKICLKVLSLAKAITLTPPVQHGKK